MLVTGWLDPEVNTTIYNYTHFKTEGGSALTRNNVKLIVGPWPHGCVLPGQFGGVSFGRKALAPVRSGRKNSCFLRPLA